MAVRHGRRARLRRAARGRAGAVGVVAAGLALYLAAGLLALSPALRHAHEDFLGWGETPAAGVAPGDHLQTVYNLWLPGHQLADGRAPWLDRYSFQPVADERTNFPGWPFALVFGPAEAAFGAVAGWNAFLLLTYVGAGGLAALWLRSLGLPLGAALAGGVVFALAPYRSAQTAAGHLLAPASMLLPLSLWALERRIGWLAVAALASIPLSGQVHLALGAIAFFLAYALVRGRPRLGVAGASVAVASGLLVYAVAIRGTIGARDRSFAQVDRYSAELADFVAREARHGLETLVFLGWLTPLVALVGLSLLRRERGLAALLGAAAVIPIVFALGSNTPLYEPVWRLVPGLGSTRVPGRLLPIACLAIAALVAFAVARLPRRALVAAAVLVLALDVRVSLYRPLGGDERNEVYARLRGEPPGRMLERPVHLPDRQEASVYLYYLMQAPREHAGGYSTTAPPAADAVARRLRSGAIPEELGVRYIVEFSDGVPRRYVRRD